MRKIAALAACTALFFASLISSEAADAVHPEICYLIVTEHWPRSTQAAPSEMAKARDRLFRDLAALVQAAYKNGGYIHDPTSFPFGGDDFRDDHIVFGMRGSCPRARMFLSELLEAYRKRLSTKEKAIGPDLVVEDRPATEYEARCGVGATAATCE